MPPTNSSGGAGHHHKKKIGVNKAYKGHSKNATKRAVGRIDREDLVKPNNNPKALKLDNRAARLNHSKQLQRQHREEVAIRKRLGGKNGSPKIVAIVPLSANVDVNAIAHHLTQQCKIEQLIENPLSYCTTLTADVEKKEARFTFTAVPRDPIAVADVAKVADVVYLVVAPQVNQCTDEEWSQMQQDSTMSKSQEPFVDRVLGVDALGNHFIQLLKAQGLPTTIGVAQGVTNQTSVNKQKWVARLVQQYFHYVFDKDVSSFPLDNGDEHMKTLLRATYNITPREIPWREERTRMFGEAVEYVKNTEYDIAQAAQNGPDAGLYDMTKGTMKVTGFLRGKHSISANQLIHITGFGDYQAISIEAYENAHIHKGSQPQKLRLLSNPEERTSLEGLLGTSEQEAMMHGSSVAFESSDNINMAEFNQALAQGQGTTTNLATGSQALGGEDLVLSQGGIYGAKTGKFLDWRSQNTTYIRSFSSLSSGTDVVNQDAPVFTNDVIKTQKRQDDKGLIQSVWDSIDLDGNAGDKDNLTMNRYDRKIALSEVMDASLLQSDSEDDDDDEMDDEAMSYRAIRREKRDLKKQQQESDGFSTTSSLLSTLSGFSMGSLRDPNLTPEQLKEKFNDLPYKEKVRKLMKYGDRGEDKLLKVRTRMEREEVSNPDEVDYHPDVTARARFVRYHPMKSYRHSVWDVNENLPAEYNNIIQFNHFEVSVKNAKDRAALVDEDDIFEGEEFEDEDEMVDDEEIEERQAARLAEITTSDGARLISRINPDRLHPITVYLSNVPQQVYEYISTYKAYGLLWWLFNHERKVSVAHMLIRRHTEYTPPVRTKDPMHIQIGFRRFISAPIFSEVDPHADDRALVKRFLPNDEKFYLSSCYSRITFPPASVLMFSAHVLGSYKAEFPFNPLVASGRLVSFDPNKLLLKRAVLSGYPESVSKYKIVVRHMFYNASDVKWFKPVELWTKRGHSGHILDSRGLHGTFKAVFDKTFKEKCSVHLSLYKRQFPVWNPLYLG